MQPDEKTVFTEPSCHQHGEKETGPHLGTRERFLKTRERFLRTRNQFLSFILVHIPAGERTNRLWDKRLAWLLCLCLCKCVDRLVSEPCSSSDHRYNGYTLARLLLFQPTNERKAGSPSTLCSCVFVYELLCQSFTIIVALIAISLCWCFENYANTVGAHLLQK